MSTRNERRLQHEMNRLHNLVPGASRIWELTRIAVEMYAEAQRLEDEAVPGADPEGLRKDALFIERLEYDLISMREAIGRPVRGTANRKYDPTQWGRGPRP